VDPERVKGLKPVGGQSWSIVNLLLRLQIGAGDDRTPMFALAHWVLPRVPAVGEEIQAIGFRMTVDRVTWDIEGRAVVRLREGHLEPPALEALEQEGWSVQSWDVEPPSDWLAG
jgi:hypothetical protein